MPDGTGDDLFIRVPRNWWLAPPGKRPGPYQRVHGLDIYAKAVYVTLLAYGDWTSGRCTVAFATITEALGIDWSVAHRAVDDLEAAGVLTVKRQMVGGRHKANQYQVELRPAVPEQPDRAPPIPGETGHQEADTRLDRAVIPGQTGINKKEIPKNRSNEIAAQAPRKRANTRFDRVLPAEEPGEVTEEMTAIQDWQTELKEALVDVLGYDRNHITPADWKKIEVAAKQLRAAGRHGADVRTMAAHYAGHFGGCAMTATAIAGHHLLLMQPPKSSNGRTGREGAPNGTPQAPGNTPAKYAHLARRIGGPRDANAPVF